MKNHPLYILVVCMLLLSSCSTDNEIITKNENTSNLEVRIQETQENSSNTNKNLSTSDELTLNMHWISFTISEVILANELARQDFSNKMSGKQSVLLEELIGPIVQGEFKDAFEARISENFSDVLFYLICAPDPTNCDEPEHPTTTPPLPTGPTGAPIHSDNIPGVKESIHYLIDYALNDHCIEIFVPKSIPYSGTISEIAATEHPLSGAQSHGATLLTNQIDEEYGYRYIYHNIISSSYLQGISAGSNYAIVTRPKRVFSICDYTDYSKIDFTNFFN